MMQLLSKKNNKYSTIIETIKCLNIACQKGEDEEAENNDLEISHRLTYEECLQFIQNSSNQQYKDEYSATLLDIVVPNNSTILRCPRQGWEYFGHINPRNKCSDFLYCEKCDYNWIEPSLTPFCKKMRKWLWSWNLNLNLLNQFQKVTRAQAWPGWGISIIKGPGCKHMTWQKWRKEFCWYCLGDYPSYVHKGVIFWPFRIILKVLIWIWLAVFTVNLKFAIMFPTYQRFMVEAATWTGIWLLANIMFLSISFAFVFKQMHHEFRHSTDWWTSVIKYFGWFLAFLWPAAWIAGWVLAYHYWRLATTMLWILLWQFVSLAGIAVIVFLFIVIFKWIQKRIEVRRTQRFYRDLQANGIPNEGSLGENLIEYPAYQLADPDNNDNYGNALSILFQEPSDMIPNNEQIPSDEEENLTVKRSKTFSGHIEKDESISSERNWNSLDENKLNFMIKTNSAYKLNKSVERINKEELLYDLDGEDRFSSKGEIEGILIRSEEYSQESDY